MTSPRSSVAPSEDLQSVVSDRELPVILAGRLEDELVVQQPSVGGIGEDGPSRELRALGSDARSEQYDPTVPQVPTGDSSKAGLDERGNILLNTFLKADAEFLREVRLLHPLKRDVDWRGEWKSCVTQSRRRACIVQQAGEMAPQGGECRSCGNGRGAFKSCCVLTYADQILFGGACGNCGFNQGGNKCSLREPGQELAGWVRDYLAKSNPSHELVRGKVAEPRGAATPVAKRTRGSQEKGKSSSEAGPSGTRETQADKDEAAKNKAEWERAVKERAEKERAAKEKADKERAAKEKAEKEKANKERAAAKGKGKRKRYFENDWLNSPLNDPTVTNREDFTRAAEAYDAIPDMVEALQEAREALRAWLIDNKQLSEDEEEEEEEEEEDDPFAAYTKKRKRAE